MTDDPPKKDDPTAQMPQATPTATEAPAPPPEAFRGPTAPRFADAPATGDIPAMVLALRSRSDASTHLIVYVGATWCEPCQRFHQAVQSGALDADLKGFLFLAFDMDRDRERLAAAGYRSKFIPLFVIPGADGRGDSGKQMEGSITGPGSPHEITPRLLALIAK